MAVNTMKREVTNSGTLRFVILLEIKFIAGFGEHSSRRDTTHIQIKEAKCNGTGTLFKEENHQIRDA